MTAFVLEAAGLLLVLAPVLAVVAPLLRGRFVGEEALERWAAARRARPAPRRRRRGLLARPSPAVLLRTVALPRGGSLVAGAVGVRPPPGLRAR